jgi:uncharacterized protein
MASNNSGRVVVSTLPDNAPDWLVVIYLLKYMAFPNPERSPALEHLVVRPIINTSKILLVVSLHLLPATALVVLVVVFFRAYLAVTIVGVLVYGVAACVHKRRNIVIWLIRIYQARASAEVRLRCKLRPSCSEYMVECVQKYGAIVGVRRGLQRVRTCGDPVVASEAHAN